MHAIDIILYISIELFYLDLFFILNIFLHLHFK